MLLDREESEDVGMNQVHDKFLYNQELIKTPYLKTCLFSERGTSQ